MQQASQKQSIMPQLPNPKHFTQDGENINNIQDQIMQQKQLQGYESEDKNWVSHSKSQENSSETNAQDFDPLQQHKTVLEYIILGNSFTSFTLSSILKKQNNQRRTTIFKSITLQQYLPIWLQKLRLVKPDLVDLFISYTETQKNCRRFLQHLYYSYSSLAIHVLFKYLFFIWELYYPYIDSTLTLQAQICASQNISTKIYQTEIKSIRHLRDRAYPNERGLKKIIKILTVTFIFVMQQHPNNPYYSSIKNKRKCDDKQDQKDFILQEDKQGRENNQE